MARYTRDELKKIKQMREEEIVKSAAEHSEWLAAGVGHSAHDRYYIIEYRRVLTDSMGNELYDMTTKSAAMSPWFSCDPFYEPLSTDPGRTHDRHEAYEVAAALLDGTRATHKQATPGDTRIDEVQVIEQHFVSTILKRLP